MHHTAPGLIFLRRAQRALPRRPKVFYQTLGTPLRQGRLRLCAQRKPIGNLQQCRQVEFVRHQLAVGRHRLPAANFPVHLHDADIAARPAQAILRLELQGLSLELKAAAKQAPLQTARHRAQLQRCKAAAQSRVHVGKPNIGGGARDFAAAHIDPGAQGTLAARNGKPEVRMACQPG